MACEGTSKLGVRYTVQIADPDHPVTHGLSDFEVVDETYGNYTVDSDVHVLLTTDHPDSGSIIGWAKTYRNSPLVYIQLGHDGTAYANPNYRKLVDQAIRWTVSRAGGSK